MKFINALTLLASITAVTVGAAPAPAPAEVDGLAAPVAFGAPIETRDLNAAQCRAACDRGADAVERFCRLIPEPRIRAFCWGAAAAVETPIGLRACTSFCDAFF